MGDARLARESVEVLIQTPGDARLAREAIEVLVAAASGANVFTGWGVPL